VNTSDRTLAELAEISEKLRAVVEQAQELQRQIAARVSTARTRDQQHVTNGKLTNPRRRATDS
jgi:hypothetical protein